LWNTVVLYICFGIYILMELLATSPLEILFRFTWATLSLAAWLLLHGINLGEAIYIIVVHTVGLYTFS